MTDKTKLCILVEIQLDRPVKADLITDVARRLERSAYDLIVARGGDCSSANAKIHKQPMPITEERQIEIMQRLGITVYGPAAEAVEALIKEVEREHSIGVKS